jgi:XTP/dITP diphosphohydrolase
MIDLVLATANPHKTHEMRAILEQLGFRVHPRPSDVGDVDETAATLEGNALLKAHALVSATGMVAVADDTGLFVDALGGQPGVRSARYAGETATDNDNVVKLLVELGEGLERSARFRTVIAVVYPDGREVVVEGSLEGEIALAPRGSGGFGYDPVFAANDTPGRTLAELSPDEKNTMSHRARALRALPSALSA